MQYDHHVRNDDAPVTVEFVIEFLLVHATSPQPAPRRESAAETLHQLRGCQRSEGASGKG